MTGYTFFGWPPQQQPMGMGAPGYPPQQHSNVVYVPVQSDSHGKMKPKSAAKQFKEWLEFQELMEGKGKKKEEKKDEKKDEGVLKMSPITFLMWLLALSIPIGAGQFMLYQAIGRSVKASFGG